MDKTEAIKALLNRTRVEAGEGDDYDAGYIITVEGDMGDKGPMTNALVIAKKIGAIALEDNAQWMNRFQIRSETSNRLYTVAQRKSDGTWGCSCPGWKSHRCCKHLNQLQPVLKQLGKS